MAITKNYSNNNSVYIRTFGCQVNVRDSEVIKGLLTAEGYKLTDNPKRADGIHFNTCSVRQHAEDKVWSEIDNIALYLEEALRSDKRVSAFRECRCREAMYRTDFHEEKDHACVVPRVATTTAPTASYQM